MRFCCMLRMRNGTSHIQNSNLIGPMTMKSVKQKKKKRKKRGKNCRAEKWAHFLLVSAKTWTNFFPFFFLFLPPPKTTAQRNRQMQRRRRNLNWDVINNLRLAWFYLLMLDVFGLFNKERDDSRTKENCLGFHLSLGVFSPKIASLLLRHTQYSSLSICRPLKCLSILY